MKHEEATVPPAPMGQVDQGVRPAMADSEILWIYDEVVKNLGESLNELSFGRSVAMRAAALERERCAKLCDLHARLTWNDDRKAQSRALAAEIRRGGPNSSINRALPERNFNG